MKTKGQILYEYKHPSKIKVIPYNRRHFTTVDDIFLVDNPNFQTPWKFLTNKCKESWEVSAKGHHIFSEQIHRV